MNGSRRNGLIEIDLGRRTVYANGKEARLTLTEFELLLALAECAPLVAMSSYLLSRVWGYKECLYVAREKTRVVVHHLRRKIGDDTRRMIVSVRGIGYRLDTGVLVVREAATTLANGNQALLSVSVLTPTVGPLLESPIDEETR